MFNPCATYAGTANPQWGASPVCSTHVPHTQARQTPNSRTDLFKCGVIKVWVQRPDLPAKRIHASCGILVLYIDATHANHGEYDSSQGLGSAARPANTKGENVFMLGSTRVLAGTRSNQRCWDPIRKLKTQSIRILHICCR